MVVKIQIWLSVWQTFLSFSLLLKRKDCLFCIVCVVWQHMNAFVFCLSGFFFFFFPSLSGCEQRVLMEVVICYLSRTEGKLLTKIHVILLNKQWSFTAPCFAQVACSVWESSNPGCVDTPAINQHLLVTSGFWVKVYRVCVRVHTPGGPLWQTHTFTDVTEHEIVCEKVINKSLGTHASPDVTMTSLCTRVSKNTTDFHPVDFLFSQIISLDN